jgi:hypothetical protein
MRVSELSRGKLETWRDSLIRRTDDPEERRRSQDTANRVLTIVKAVLNHAVADPSHGLTDGSAWRLVRPFQRVARAREVHFTSEEVRQLLDAIPDPCFRSFVTAGFLTGARYGGIGRMSGEALRSNCRDAKDPAWQDRLASREAARPFGSIRLGRLPHRRVVARRHLDDPVCAALMNQEVAVARRSHVPDDARMDAARGDRPALEFFGVRIEAH